MRRAAPGDVKPTIDPAPSVSADPALEFKRVQRLGPEALDLDIADLIDAELIGQPPARRLVE